MTRLASRRMLITGIVVLAAIGAVIGLAMLFVRGTPPPAVGLGSPSPAAATPSGTAPSPAVTEPAGTLGPGGLDGTWTIDTTIGSFDDFSSSFVGYRVDETFVDNRSNTAVGRTPGVAGSLTLAGTSITAVEITADMTRLRSDDDRRDGRLETQAIETRQFPEASFRLTAPIELGGGPVEGQVIQVAASGELTLHGVTRPVTVPLEARLAGDVVTVTGSIEIEFADYSIERPTSFLVLSIEDHGIMEFQLHFRRG